MSTGPRRSYAVALAVACACGAGPVPEASRSASAERGRGTVDRPSPAVSPSGTKPAVPVEEIAALVAKFSGGRRCDADARAALQRLREVHGTAALREALNAAFTACDEPGALADLAIETLAVDAPVIARLGVGAALIRATRYQEAADRLVPIATAEGPTSKAAWLAGFALFHAGHSAEALPLLESARDQAGPGVGDASLLIGLARLHGGDVDGAITELEGGRTGFPDNPSIAGALARAYATAGRRAESEAVAAAAVALNEAIAQREAAATHLTALGVDLGAAMAAGKHTEADALIEQMLALAPAPAKRELLGVRAKLYQAMGRTADAEQIRASLAAPAVTPP